MEKGSFQSANAATSLSLSPNFILPEHKRPNLSQVYGMASIPIIDLNQEEPKVIEQVSKACEEYGFFQIINHAIPQELCERMISTIAEFFESPAGQRANFFTTDHTKQIRLFNYYLKVDGQEDNVQMWSESFSHPWHPLDDIIHLLPENPPQYREVFSEYAKEIGELMSKVLGLISRGLGLEKDCLKKRLGEKPLCKAQANFYPPCPEPELTLGLAVHTDINALTIVSQSEGVSGLQVIKDGQWLAVDPIPNAFVINLGDQIQVLSNGRYKSAHHRAVTNKVHQRISLATFYGPDRDAMIGPIEDLIDEKHPPVYRHYRYTEFLQEFYKQEGTRRMVKEKFELN